MATCGEVCDNGKQTCTIEATVPTGFESVAAEEAKEMFQTECKSTRGRITFQTPAERVKDILKLGGIDHCRAQVLHVPYFGFTPDGDDCLSRLQLLVKQSNWEEGLSIWSKFYSFNHPISSRPDRIPTDEEMIDICYSVHMPGHKAAGEGKKKNRKDKRKGKKGRNERGRKEEEGKTVGDSEDATVSETSAAAAAVQGGPAGIREEDSESGLKARSEEGAGDGPVAERKGSGEAPVSASTSVAGTCNETVSDQGQGEQPLVQKLTEHCDSEDAVHANEGGADSENLSKQPLISTEENYSGSGNSANSPVKTGLPASAGEQVDSTVASPAVCPSRNVTEPENPDQSSDDRKTDSRSNSKREKKPRDPTKPAFRVTCKRAGENHSFDSMSAAASFGSAMQTYFGWQVDMTDYDIEVVLTIDNNEVSVGLALTPESLHKRNLVAFGVTTLRPTICHNMLRMVKVCPGHIVCDPLCGTSSISIQGALNFPAFQLCGDNHNIAMEKTRCNKDALNAKRTANGSGGLMMDAVQWNACHLPLRDGIVDVFVSDLPFGKRVGRRFDNQKLYCNVLDEMARCGKFTGRAALLTGDMNNMMKAIQAQKYWARRRCYSCNIGGIAAAVFLLYRTMLPYLPRSQARATASHESDQKQPPPPVSDQNGSAPSTHEQAGPGQTTPGQGGVGSQLSNQGGMELL